MYYVVQNKGAVTAQLICAFVFAYAKKRFSHDAAHDAAHITIYITDLHGVCTSAYIWSLWPPTDPG